MIDLSDPKTFKEFDPKDVFGSSTQIPDQATHVWQDFKEIPIPDSYQNIDNIVISAMGGSAYSGYVVQSLFKQRLKVPVVLNNDYSLPNFVNEKTLVLLVSYSGTTEEVIAAAKDAQKKNAKVTGVAVGGDLEAFLKQNNYPAFIFNPKYNPSNQPRMGTGYMLFGSLSILSRLGVIPNIEMDVLNAAKENKEDLEDLQKEAQALAPKLLDLMPIIISAEFLSGNANIMRNQYNENSKNFASFSLLPELNHHLMEGLKNPTDNKLAALFIESDLYSDKLKQRIELTKDVISKNNIPNFSYSASGTTKLSQILNVITFGMTLTFYVAMLYKLDPSVIPWVNYFKNQLKK